MGESFREWLEHRKVLRSLDDAQREIEDEEGQDSGSEESRRHETYSRVAGHRETADSSEEERPYGTSSNRPTPSPSPSQSSHETSADYNQGPRFEEESQYHENDEEYWATYEGGNEEKSEADAATSSEAERELDDDTESEPEFNNDGSADDYGYDNCDDYEDYGDDYDDDDDNDDYDDDDDY